jgi:hypothetical protein
VEAGYYTSIVALLVVRGDEKGTQCPRVYLAHPVPGGYKYNDLALQVGGISRIGTIKYDPAGLRSECDCAGEDQQHSKLQTRPLVREGVTK